MTSEVFLVTGVTGRHGGTGAVVAEALLTAGRRVRMLARREDAHTAALQKAGAELVLGDLRDRRTLLPALSGIESAYFTWPVAAGIVEAAGTLASAGRKQGLKRVVVMSMGAANPESPSALARAQWLAEDLLALAGFDCVPLRIAAFFFENLELLHGDELGPGGVLRNSFGDVPVAWMAAHDAAKVAVAALLHPERFVPGAAVYPTGPHRHSHGELARMLGAHFGHPLTHQTIARDEWEHRLLERAKTEPRISPEMPAHVAALGAAVREPRPVNDQFETLTGARPASLEELLRSGALFARRDAPAHGR